MAYSSVTYRPVMSEAHRATAAALDDQAFGGKNAKMEAERAKRLAILECGLLVDHGIAALTDAALVGLAGYALPEGSLNGGIDGRRFERFTEMCQDLPDRLRLGNERRMPTQETSTGTSTALRCGFLWAITMIA
jgi:hypothetical protein